MIITNSVVVMMKVWMQVRTMADMDNIQPALHDIVTYLQPWSWQRTAKSMFGRLLVAATLYFISNERKNRLFKKEKRSSDELRNIIMVTVRLKLMTFRFKNTMNVQQMLGK
ncbi:hypothetical protein Tco_0150349 [Tanacetum coccineum]